MPLVPHTEFGWWVRLRDPQGPLQWREEMTLSSPPRNPGGATRVQPNVLVRDGVARPADGWIGQTWVIDEGDPEGEHTIRVFVDGSLVHEFSFRTYRTAATPAPIRPLPPVGQGSCTPARQCCKICTIGQACGNTCISASYACHVGRGCACNSLEMCR